MAGMRWCRRLRVWPGRRSGRDGGKSPRRGADRPYTPSGRRAAVSRTEPARSAGRPRSAREPAVARRPDVAATLDLQESGEADRGADPTGVASGFDDRRPDTSSTALPATIGPQTSGGSEPPGSQRAVRVHQRDCGRVSVGGQPVISVDTKKKELVGNFKHGGRERQPKGSPPSVLVHDFPTDAAGKAIPYGVYIDHCPW